MTRPQYPIGSGSSRTKSSTKSTSTRSDSAAPKPSTTSKSRRKQVAPGAASTPSMLPERPSSQQSSSSSSDDLAQEATLDDTDEDGYPVTTKGSRKSRAGLDASFFKGPSTQLANSDDAHHDATSSPRATTAVSTPSKGSATRKRQSKITDSPAVRKTGTSGPRHPDVYSTGDSMPLPKKSTAVPSLKKQLHITDMPAVRKTGADGASPLRSSVTSNKFTKKAKRQSKLTDLPARRTASTSNSTSAAGPARIASDAIVLSEESDSDGLFTPKKVPLESKKSTAVDSTDDDSIILPVKKRGASQKQAAAGDDTSDSDIRPATRKTEQRKTSYAKQVASSDSDSDDVVAPATRRTPMRGLSAHGAAKRAAPADDDDDVVQTGSRRGPSKASDARTSTKRTAPSDDSDSGVQTTKRRRIARRAEASSSCTASESEPPLRSSQAKTPGRSWRKDPKSEKKKLLEMRRRKRAGETIEEEESSEEEDDEEPRRALYDSDPDLVALETFEDDEEGVLNPGGSSPARNAKKKKDAKGKGKGKAVEVLDDTEDGDSDANSFISDDSDGQLGVPDDGTLALIQLKNQPLKTHFRLVVKWLIQFKIQPDFEERQDTVYAVAWGKLNDELQSLGISKFVSSVWVADFLHALKARPEFIAVSRPPSLFPDENRCMACNRTNHPASWTVTFSGTAYYKDPRYFNPPSGDPKFLEEIVPPSDDEDDSDSEDEGERDEDNNRLPPADTEFHIGATCKSNAETAHSLIHWKWSLLEWVGGTLEAQGYLKPSNRATLAKMKPSKRIKYVEKILERWEKAGDVEGNTPILTALYNDFKRHKKAAHEKETTGNGRRGRW